MKSSSPDEFARSLFEEAKHFFEKALEEAGEQGQVAYLHAAVVLGFSALEAHVNSIADDFAEESGLPLLERGLLTERDIELINGEFAMTDRLKQYRLADRIQFIHRKFAKKAIDKDSSWWSDFKAGLKLRNALAHPKEVPTATPDNVERALTAITRVLDALFRAVYSVDLPAAGRGLNSDMSF